MSSKAPRSIIATSIVAGASGYLLGNRVTFAKNDLSFGLPSPLVLTPDQFFSTNGVNNVPSTKDSDQSSQGIVQPSQEEGYIGKSLTVEGVSHLIMKQLNDKIVTSLIRSPPTTIEVESVMEVFRERPETVAAIIPGADAAQTVAVLSIMKHVVTNPDLIDSVADIIKKNEKEEKKKIVSSVPSFEHPPKEWLELRYKYPCCICQDVLAAPVLLECEHSFCGHCIEENCQACQSDDVEVVYKCPVCCEEYAEPRYERQLDDIICEAVEDIPDCRAKRDWMERRDLYLSERKKKVSERIAVPVPGVEYETASLWVACMVVTVITLIVLARSRK